MEATIRRLALIMSLLAAPTFAHAADAPAPAAPPAPKGVHFLYLIRHGAYDRDTVNTDDRIGSPLNALGHEQAKLTGARLATLPVRLHALVSSDFTRARQTADDIGAIVHLAPMRDSLIHECTPTADNANLNRDKSPAEIALCESNLAAAWKKYVVPTPDADTYDVLVCHGNVIRNFVAKAMSDDMKHWSRMDIGNGSITVLAVRADGSVRLAAFSDTGHIPLEKQTWTGRGAGWMPPAPAPHAMK
jgi:serine/threonine-protein phosphatase PGAM5